MMDRREGEGRGREGKERKGREGEGKRQGGRGKEWGGFSPLCKNSCGR